MAAESPGWYTSSTVGRVVSIALLLTLLSRLGRLYLAGFTRPGRWPTWLATLPLLAYMIMASAVAMTGNLNFGITDPALISFVALFLLTHAFLEEVAFRGLIMVAFMADQR